MKKLQNIGGIGALYLAAAYIVGMLGFLAVVDISGIVDPVQKVASSKVTIFKSSETSICFGVRPPRNTLSELAISSIPRPSR